MKKSIAILCITALAFAGMTGCGAKTEEAATSDVAEEVIVEGDIVNLGYSEKDIDKKAGGFLGKIFK